MANTTNFGWETPDDTDLVKDGALAMRTLGNAIDTSLVDLKGGTTGQILSKNSNTDMDFTWIANDQGDITEVVAGTGLSGGGSSGSVTLTNTVATAFDSAGDIVYGTGADTFTKLGIGTAGQVLTVNSGATAPEWVIGGGWTSLASGSLSGATLDLTSISNGYRTLVLILRDFYPNNDDYLRIALNNTTSVYGQTGPGGADSSLTNTYITPFSTINVDNVDSFNYLQFQIDDYANTTTGKSGYNRGAVRNTSGTTWRIQSLDSFANLTAAIDRITVSFNGGATFSGGTYQLYGVK